MTTLEDLSTAEIEVTLAHENGVCGDLEEELNDVNRRIGELEAELARRQLAEYWKAHPELIPVNVGDKLMITQLFIDDRQGRGGIEGWLNQNIVVCGIYVSDDDMQIALDGSTNGRITLSVGSVPISIVQEMRRAYLSKYNAATMPDN